MIKFINSRVPSSDCADFKCFWQSGIGRFSNPGNMPAGFGSLANKPCVSQFFAFVNSAAIAEAERAAK